MSELNHLITLSDEERQKYLKDRFMKIYENFKQIAKRFYRYDTNSLLGDTLFKFRISELSFVSSEDLLYLLNLIKFVIDEKNKILQNALPYVTEETHLRVVNAIIEFDKRIDVMDSSEYKEESVWYNGFLLVCILDAVNDILESRIYAFNDMYRLKTFNPFLKMKLSRLRDKLYLNPPGLL